MEKIVKNLQKEVYVKDGLTDNQKNAYYISCGGYNVIVRSPRKYLPNGRFEHIDSNIIPTYTVLFEAPEMATKFIEKSIDSDCTRNIDIKQAGSAVIIKPTNINYQLWIELDSEALAKKMVRLFRRQYISNVQLQQPAELVK